MKKFQLDIVDRHAIITEGQNVILIDTGSPFTINQTSEFYFLEKAHRVKTLFSGASATNINILENYVITTLLGTDILSKYNIEFNYRENEVTFFDPEETFTPEGDRLTITSTSAIPVITAIVDGKQTNLFIDCGAKFSYIRKEFTLNKKSVQSEEDFYPGLGKFNINLYELPVLIDGNPIDTLFGVLPDRLSSLLSVNHGLIGSDLFLKHKVYLSLSEKYIMICRYE